MKAHEFERFLQDGGFKVVDTGGGCTAYTLTEGQIQLLVTDGFHGTDFAPSPMSMEEDGSVEPYIHPTEVDVGFGAAWADTDLCCQHFDSYELAARFIRDLRHAFEA